MAEIRNVETEVMFNEVNNLDNLIGEWNNCVQTIDRYKVELDAMWDGLANDQFNARWVDDLNRYNKLASVLEEYRRAVKHAAEQYEQYEADIAAIVKDN